MGPQLVAALRGMARQVVTDLPVAQQYDCPTVVGALSANFGPCERAELYMAELRGRVRKPRESARELGQSIQRLATLAYPELNRRARDRLARTHFADAIGDADIRMRLFEARPETLHEAVTVALEVEAFQRVEQQRGTKRHRSAGGDTVERLTY